MSRLADCAARGTVHLDRITRHDVTHVTRPVTNVIPFNMMLAQKRKRRDPGGNYSSKKSVIFDNALSDNDIDISSALTGKKARVIPAAEDSDDDFQKFLHESISKRDIKNGTEVVKKTKGKGKITKGEVGGGSFQSMGQAVAFNAIMGRRD
jgi:hypothetical protein